MIHFIRIWPLNWSTLCGVCTALQLLCLDQYCLVLFMCQRRNTPVCWHTAVLMYFDVRHWIVLCTPVHSSANRIVGFRHRKPLTRHNFCSFSISSSLWLSTITFSQFIQVQLPILLWFLRASDCLLPPHSPWLRLVLGSGSGHHERTSTCLLGALCTIMTLSAYAYLDQHNSALS